MFVFTAVKTAWRPVWTNQQWFWIKTKTNISWNHSILGIVTHVLRIILNQLMLGLEFEKNTYVFWQPELFCEFIYNSSNKTKQFLLISSEDDTYTWTFCSTREIRRPQDNNKIANLIQTRYGAQMRGFSHSLSPSFVLSNCNCTICRSVATALLPFQIPRSVWESPNKQPFLQMTSTQPHLAKDTSHIKLQLKETTCSTLGRPMSEFMSLSRTLAGFGVLEPS